MKTKAWLPWPAMVAEVGETPPPVAPPVPVKAGADGVTALAAESPLLLAVSFTWNAVAGAVNYTVVGSIDGAALQEFGTTPDGLTTQLGVSLTGSNIVWLVRTNFAGTCPATDSAQNFSFTLEKPDTCAAHQPANDRTERSSCRDTPGTRAGPACARDWRPSCVVPSSRRPSGT